MFVFCFGLFPELFLPDQRINLLTMTPAIAHLNYFSSVFSVVINEITCLILTSFLEDF